jgi:hypothetical protein
MKRWKCVRSFGEGNLSQIFGLLTVNHARQQGANTVMVRVKKRSGISFFRSRSSAMCIYPKGGRRILCEISIHWQRSNISRRFLLLLDVAQSVRTSVLYSRSSVPGGFT